jgi:hypothetical protein
MGLTPGTYAVTVAGAAVSGSPFTVAAGDNSIYFNTVGGGSVSLTQGSAQSLSTSESGSVSRSGNTVIH